MTTLKELQKDKASQKISKLAYFQVVHELLTPLSTIIPFLELIKNSIKPELEIYDFI